MNRQSDKSKNKTKDDKINRGLKITMVMLGGILCLILLIELVCFLVDGRILSLERGHIYLTPFSCEADEFISCEMTADLVKPCSCHEASLNGNGHIRSLKPIIYLYPEVETDINVKVGYPERLTTTYPKYNPGGWNVKAFPNGDLIENATGRKFYALYWEGLASYENIEPESGFIVSGEDSVEFLEEKLAILGLNYKESEEFITYWLPKMEKNKYNQVYFLSEKKIEEDMPIETSIKPDTIIRVRMIIRGMDEYREIPEQKLTPAPERKGFTLVEWGGSEI